MSMTPRVVDIYRGDTVGGSGPAVDGFKMAAAAGIWGVIHKASQGSGFRDKMYASRRQAALDAGLLWGAYHFNDGSDVEDQVHNFLEAATPDAHTLVCLDYEDNPRSNLSIQGAAQWLHTLEQHLGRKAVIYSGNRLKENVGDLSAPDFDYVTKHKLWLCQYGPRAILPRGWKSYFLWQYTGDGVGQGPHTIPGITCPGNGGIDLNVYAGDQDDLASEWAS